LTENAHAAPFSRWEVLTRLFGPYHEFIENFTKYVLGKGFLGLINR